MGEAPGQRSGPGRARAAAAPLAARLAAVVAAARGAGVPCGEPRVLHDGYNLSVHLAPSPVVARLMTLLPGDDASRWRAVLARELEVADHLRRRGVPVVPPADGLPPGPHPCGDTHFTLWRLASRCGEDGRTRPDPDAFATHLRRLENGMASFPGDLPALGAWRQVSRPDAALCGAPEDASWLDQAWRRVDARLSELSAQHLMPAHGEAHAGNLLWVHGVGWAWHDFEDASRMPCHWDAVCAVWRGALPGAEGPETGWAAAVRERVLGPAAGGDAFRLALAARAVLSLCGGLTAAAAGLQAGGSARARLGATRRLLAELGMEPG